MQLLYVNHAGRPTPQNQTFSERRKMFIFQWLNSNSLVKVKHLREERRIFEQKRDMKSFDNRNIQGHSLNVQEK